MHIAGLMDAQKLVLICNFSSKEKDIELSEDYENVIFVNYEQTTVIGNTLKNETV